ncbi:rhomboid domain-containing protein, partial [Favolaschia claudopus]
MLLSSFRQCSRHTFPRIYLPRRTFTYCAPRRSTATLNTSSLGLNSQPSLAQKIGRPSVRNQAIFAVLGTCAIFVYAAAWTNIETDEWVEKLTHGRAPRTWPHTITSADMRNASNFALAQELREGLKNVGVFTEALPIPARNIIMRVWANVAQTYLNVTEGKRLCWKICLLNIGIWLAWKSKRLHPFMRRNYVHDPLSGRSITMLTSMFGSRLAIVLGMNVFFLDGFGSSASFHLLQRQERMPEGQLESTSRLHFLAFFVSAGLFAALTSHIIRLKLLYPRIIARLSLPSNQPVAKPDTWASALRDPAPTSRLRSFFRWPFPSSTPLNPLIPRAGATGVLYAIMTLTALGFPSAEIALFYPPNYSVPVQWGVGSLLLLDVFGIWRGWRFFDHFAHLGGAAFGAIYYVYGPQFWNWLRIAVANRAPQSEKQP